jgi:ubiquinone/menaquinone biosynthesis C-methylase UbiE
MYDFGFKAMAFAFKIRDLLKPRKDIAKEVGITEGFHVLDYGCGSGSYITAVAELVGKSEIIYALDINPTAVEMTKNAADKNGLTNVQTILSDCKTELSDSVDVVLPHNIFHGLTDRKCVLEELHRVLKPEGIVR